MSQTVLVYRRHWRWNPARALLTIQIILLFAVFLYLIIFFTADRSEGEIGGYEEIIVEKGDTLWSLACRYYPDLDPRKVVAEIREINRLANPTLYPGQKLEIPR